MQSTTAINGSDVLLYVDVGTAQAPDFKPVAAQRNMGVNETANVIDVSAKGDKINKGVYGRITGDITLDAVIVESPQGLKLIRQAMWNKKEIVARVVTLDLDEDGEVVEGEAEDAFCIVTSVNRNYPDEEASTYSVGLRINSEWTPAA